MYMYSFCSILAHMLTFSEYVFSFLRGPWCLVKQVLKRRWDREKEKVEW